MAKRILVTPGAVLNVRLGNNLGTAIFVRPTNAGEFRAGTRKLVLELPDGSRLQCKYKANPINPFIGGRELPSWIRTVVPESSSRDALLSEPEPGVLRVELGQAGIELDGGELEERARELERKLDKIGHGKRGLGSRKKRKARKQAYGQWERDPLLRGRILNEWPHECQVVGCTQLQQLPAGLMDRALEVHHVQHVAEGGSDDPSNLTLLCANHHKCVHAPGTLVVFESAERVELAVGGGSKLEIQRPAA